MMKTNLRWKFMVEIVLSLIRNSVKGAVYIGKGCDEKMRVNTVVCLGRHGSDWSIFLVHPQSHQTQHFSFLFGVIQTYSLLVWNGKGYVYWFEKKIFSFHSLSFNCSLMRNLCIQLKCFSIFLPFLSLFRCVWTLINGRCSVYRTIHSFVWRSEISFYT